MKYLIVGAEGYIGDYIFSHMKMDNLDVIGTGHKFIQREDIVHYDLLTSSVSDIIGLVKGNEKTAIICIGQTNIDRCKTMYEISRQINVTAQKVLINALVSEGYNVIYFSTDNVFDGRKGNYSEVDSTNAINEYGKMKEEMEHFLLKEHPGICIFRLPKVLGTRRGNKNMVTDLEDNLRRGEVKCIKGVQMSVVSIRDVYQACLIASMKPMAGLYNLSTGEIYSRKELAEILGGIMGIFPVKVVELDAEVFGFKDKRPLKIGLSNSKFKHETGYRFYSVKEIYEDYLYYNKCHLNQRGLS